MSFTLFINLDTQVFGMTKAGLNHQATEPLTLRRCFHKTRFNSNEKCIYPLAGGVHYWGFLHLALEVKYCCIFLIIDEHHLLPSGNG